MVNIPSDIKYQAADEEFFIETGDGGDNAIPTRFAINWPLGSALLVALTRIIARFHCINRRDSLAMTDTSITKPVLQYSELVCSCTVTGSNVSSPRPGPNLYAGNGYLYYDTDIIIAIKAVYSIKLS